MELNGILTKVDLNVLPLGSYDALIGMDWLENHRVEMDCYEKFLECIDEEGKLRVVKGIFEKYYPGRFYPCNCKIYLRKVARYM